VGFEIKNSGKTIPEELQQKLFERFFRADTSRTDSAKNGYGLGLAIARKIIDVHHGEITVVSKNNMTTFTFYLQAIRKLQQNSAKA
jgi:signal transduction histidine kinase